jgi:archaellum component FlaC
VEDKTFELLTRMYNEFSGRFDRVEDRLGSVEGRLGGVENELKKVQIKLEHTIEPQIKVLFEDREYVHEKLNSIEQKIDTLSTRVDKQDMEIHVIKGGKSKAGKG